MKTIIRILSIMSIVFIFLNFINLNYTYAGYQYRPPSENNILNRPHQNNNEQISVGIDPDDYKPDKPTTDDAVEVKKKIGIILGFIRNLSVVLSVISLMIIGVKYMLGSVEQKANYKATLIPYIIGCIMAVSGTTLVSFIYNSVI